MLRQSLTPGRTVSTDCGLLLLEGIDNRFTLVLGWKQGYYTEFA